MLFFITMSVAFLAGIIVNSLLRKSINDLVEDSENIDVTNNSFFKQMKLRYENYLKTGHEINNTQAFMVKYIDKYRKCGMSFYGFEKLSAVMSGICVICGVCGAFYDSENSMQYLLMGFLAMYVITGSRRLIRLYEKKDRALLYITDFLENRFISAITSEKAEEQEQASEEEKVFHAKKEDFISPEEKQLIDEILQEYLG